MKTIYGTLVPDLHRTVYFAAETDAKALAEGLAARYDLPGLVESIPVYDSPEDLAADLAAGTRSSALAKLTPEERAALGHPDPERATEPEPAPAIVAAEENVLPSPEPVVAKAAARKVAVAADQAAAQV